MAVLRWAVQALCVGLLPTGSVLLVDQTLDGARVRLETIVRLFGRAGVSE